MGLTIFFKHCRCQTQGGFRRRQSFTQRKAGLRWLPFFLVFIFLFLGKVEVADTFPLLIYVYYFLFRLFTNWRQHWHVSAKVCILKHKQLYGTWLSMLTFPPGSWGWLGRMTDSFTCHLFFEVICKCFLCIVLLPSF